MKKYLTFAFLLMMGLTACDKCASGEVSNNGEAISNNGEAMSSSTAEVEADTDKPNPFPQTGLKPQEQRIHKVLTTDYWIINAYVKIKTPEANRQNQGKWYQFNPDGTFKVGKFTDELSTGTWSFNYNEDVGQVRLDAQNNTEDGLWNIKIAGDESLMIWVGTEEFQTTGVQMRLENLIFIPKNRKELGLKE